MSEFAKSNPNFDAKVNAATRFEDIAQLCRTDLGQRSPEPAQTQARPAVDNGFGFTRTIFVGNSRFELNSGSESGLDQQEAKIRAALE